MQNVLSVSAHMPCFYSTPNLISEVSGGAGHSLSNENK